MMPDLEIGSLLPSDRPASDLWTAFLHVSALFPLDVVYQLEDTMSLPDDVLWPLVRTCVGRHNDYALQQTDGRYGRAFSPLTYDLLRAHLMGRLTLATYVITEHNLCRFAVFDADGPDGLVQLLSVQERLSTLAVPSYLEASRRGAHLRVFLASPLSGAVVRSALRPFCPAGMEFYPKQDIASWKHPGSLVRLPLGVHLRSGRRYPFLLQKEGQFEQAAPSVLTSLAWLSTVETASAEVLTGLASTTQQAQQHQQKYPTKKASVSTPLAGTLTIRDWCAQQDPFSVIGRYVTLDDRGMGCCPFGWHHKNGQDTHPSLKIYIPDASSGYCWYCHAWGRGGSIFNFLQLYHQVEPRELWHQILSGKQVF